MTYHVSVDIAFRLINFFVLIVCALYLFKKYVRPTIENSIDEQEAYKYGLKQQLGALESRIADVEREKKSLEKHGAMLQHKVILWQEAFTHELHSQEMERALSIKHAQDRVKRQTDNLSRAKTLEKTVPLALEKVIAQLEHHYQAQGSTGYIRSIIDTMQRDSHGK